MCLLFPALLRRTQLHSGRRLNCALSGTRTQPYTKTEHAMSKLEFYRYCALANRSIRFKKGRAIDTRLSNRPPSNSGSFSAKLCTISLKWPRRRFLNEVADTHASMAILMKQWSFCVNHTRRACVAMRVHNQVRAYASSSPASVLIKIHLAHFMWELVRRSRVRDLIAV